MGRAALDLETAYSAVSETYRGAEVDIHAVCRAMRRKSAVHEDDFIALFDGPTHAGMQAGTRPTFSLFKYQDILAVLRDGASFTHGFIAEGLGAFFDGLIILAMDGEQHRRVRTLLQPAFMPEAVNKWRGKVDEIIRKDYLKQRQIGTQLRDQRDSRSIPQCAPGPGARRSADCRRPAAR